MRDAGHLIGGRQAQPRTLATTVYVRNSRPTESCICGTDTDYTTAAADLARELKDAGASSVWLAGRPDLAVDGVDGYVHAGCDALQTLRTVFDQLGVAR